MIMHGRWRLFPAESDEIELLLLVGGWNRILMFKVMIKAQINTE